jgi:Uma2 family endonuclease
VYEEAGVKEYWVIHPQEQTVLVYTLDKSGKCKGLLKPYVRTDTFSPVTLPGLGIDLNEIFHDEDV